jgi:hypothetical protein
MNAPWDDWKVAEADLDLEIEAPAEVLLANGTKFYADFLLKNFGGRNGTLVVQDYSRFAGVWEELEKLGYGFSTLDPSSRQTYDRQIYIEMLSEWSWTGDPAKSPDWLIPEDELGADD